MPDYSMRCSYNNHRSAYIAGGSTLEQAVERAKWARQYYGELYPDAALTIEISTACEECTGHGRKVKGRKNVRFPKYVACVACNGSGWFPIPAVA